VVSEPRPHHPAHALITEPEPALALRGMVGEHALEEAEGAAAVEGDLQAVAQAGVSGGDESTSWVARSARAAWNAA
jgi:hypothetical protein